MTDIDQFPSYMTWMGTALVMIGIYLIQKADNRRISDMEEEDNLETIDEIELQDKNSDKLSENDGKSSFLFNRHVFQWPFCTIPLQFNT